MNNFLLLSFRNCTDLLRVRKFLLPLVKRNKSRKKAMEAYEDESL